MSTMKATTRTESGSKSAKRLRAAGQVPGIVYGHGQAPVAVAMDMHEVEMAIQHHERLLDIDIDGKTESVMFKEVQYDALGDNIVHIDLFRVNLDETIEVSVALHLVGTPAGVNEGGAIQQINNEITIETTPRNMPEELRVDVEGLNIGDHLCAKDVVLPEGMKLVTDEEELLITISAPVSAEAEEAAEGEEGEAAEPEVIGAKKEDEEASEE